MTDALLLDTHILLWLDNGDNALRPGTREMINRCWKAGGKILVSAVTAWEMAMLAEGGRIHLDCPAEAWMERCVSQPGFEVVPLSWRACIRAYDLDGLEHRDPADRLLIATAIERRCALVTYDERISRFAVLRGQRYGLQVAG